MQFVFGHMCLIYVALTKKPHDLGVDYVKHLYGFAVFIQYCVMVKRAVVGSVRI